MFTPTLEISRQRSNLVQRARHGLATLERTGTQHCGRGPRVAATAAYPALPHGACPPIFIEIETDGGSSCADAVRAVRSTNHSMSRADEMTVTRAKVTTRSTSATTCSCMMAFMAPTMTTDPLSTGNRDRRRGARDPRTPGKDAAGGSKHGGEGTAHAKERNERGEDLEAAQSDSDKRNSYSDGTEPDTSCIPQIKRSTLLLTRRVYSWQLNVDQARGASTREPRVEGGQAIRTERISQHSPSGNGVSSNQNGQAKRRRVANDSESAKGNHLYAASGQQSRASSEPSRSTTQPSVANSPRAGRRNDPSNRPQTKGNKNGTSVQFNERTNKHPISMTAFAKSNSRFQIPSSSVPCPPPVPPGPIEFSLDHYLDPAPQVVAFFFARGSLPSSARRRSGDPPARYLELRQGLVRPGSIHAASCSNPRASNHLRKWYVNAVRWQILRNDTRPVLPLTPSRLVISPSHPNGRRNGGNNGTKPPPSQSSRLASTAARSRPSLQAALAHAQRTNESANQGSSSKKKENQAATGNQNEGNADGDSAVTGDTASSKVSPTGQSESSASARTMAMSDPTLGTPLESPILIQDGTEIARSLARAPRVIVVGDIHGCLDEFQALLRLADFQPGDQVVLLGDLVAKGPDSVAVVQMAKDIGARTVRGNHDHEVVRWAEAAARGCHQTMISPEHSRIASALGPDELSWLRDAPWFIDYPETQHLFVHAGFIPGVKLTQQNPRLMMNMRSVLTDGTVTAKNVRDCEWARLWRGPQTVVFGHDAHRGLQEHAFAKGIDTGCVYGGRLTALLLPEDRFISVPAKRCYIRERWRLRRPLPT